MRVPTARAPAPLPLPRLDHRGGRRPRRAAVQPARARRLLHRLPLVRLARPGQHVEQPARGQGRPGARLHGRVLRDHVREPGHRRPARARSTGRWVPRTSSSRATSRSPVRYTGAHPRRRVAVLRADRRHRRVVAVAAVDPVHAPRRASAQATRSSTRTSASTSSSCRSSSSSSSGCSPALVIVLIVTAVAHYLNGGIRFQSPFQRVTPQVKAHLSVILALMALVKTAQYYLGRFELNFSTRGVVEGASYTDVQGAAPRAQPADLHLDRRRRACSSGTSGAAAGCSRSSRSGCGRSSRSSIGTIYPAVDPAVQGRARTSSRRSSQYIDAQHPRDARRVRARPSVDDEAVRLQRTNLHAADGRRRRTRRRSTTRGCGTRTSIASDVPDAPGARRPTTRSATSTSTATSSTARRARC